MKRTANALSITVMLISMTCGMGRMPKLGVQPPFKLKKTETATTNRNVALALRGGGGITLPPNAAALAAKGYVGCSLYLGLWNALNPKGFWEDLGGVKVDQDSLGSFVARWSGWASLSIPILYFLQPRMDLADAAAVSTIPAYLYMTYGLLAGSMDRLGYTKAAGLVAYVYWTGIFLATLLNLPHLHPLYIPFALAALHGWLAPEIGADDLGIAFKNSDKLVWSCGSATALSALVFSYSLWKGVSLTHSVRNMSLMWLLTTLDILFLRPSKMRQANVSRPKSLSIATLSTIAVVLLSFLPSSGEEAL